MNVIIEPSWSVFDVCPVCGAAAGLACRDQRGHAAGRPFRYPLEHRMRNPHRGRKKR